MTGNFDTRKWFKKQYLEEAGINEDWDTDVDEDVLELVQYNTKMFKHILGRYEEKNKVYSCEPA